MFQSLKLYIPLRTSQEDDVSELRVLSLQLHQTLQIRSLPRWSVTFMIRQELHQVFLLVGCQKV